jgi:hypothetical protein
VPDLPEPKCASPTDCANTRPTHTSECLGDSSINDAGAPDLGAAPPPGGCHCQMSRGEAPLPLVLLALLLVLRYKRRA